MRKWLIILVVLGTLYLSFRVYAQGSVTLSTVSVEIRPEYDQPAVLVIYHLVLASNVPLPATINLRLPSDAEINAVAVSDPVRGLINTPYDRTDQGSWATLKITANVPDLQVEYYETLHKNGTSRHIVYEWPGDYPVDSFNVNLQQPAGATNLVTYPTLIQSSVGQDGFIYFASSVQSLQTGQSYTLTIDYQKTTDALSITGLPVQPVQPLTDVTPGRITIGGIKLWVFAGLGVILILVGLVGGFSLWNRSIRKLPGSGRQPAQPAMGEDTNTIYCPKCGKRAQSGDVFCRTCGTRITKEE
jgi:hypothetical protein